MNNIYINIDSGYKIKVVNDFTGPMPPSDEGIKWICFYTMSFDIVAGKIPGFMTEEFFNENYISMINSRNNKIDNILAR